MTIASTPAAAAGRLSACLNGDTIRAIAAGRALPAVRDHADLVIAAEPLTPPQVTGQIISYLESALGHAPGGRHA